VTTAELIALLRAADPDGTTPVCVDNEDVHFVQRMPAYYDGRLQQFVHDEAKRGKAWSIVGARIVSSGDKVKIRTLSIREVLFDMPDLPIEGGEPETIAEWRRNAIHEVQP